MLFNSIIFLFYFFPIFIIVYYLTKGHARQLVMLVSSLIFYAWGDVSYVPLFVASILWSYLAALVINKYRNKWVLGLSIAVHVIVFVKLKYLYFLVGAFNSIVHSNITVQDTVLPIGISFYTFQMISYLIDVYTNKTKVQTNLVTYGAYVSMFSQLIAGPIIRYEEIEEDLLNNKFNSTRFSNGVKLFIQGLFLKVVLADSFSAIIDQINNRDASDQYVVLLWLMTILYTLQIYLDFNAYSKMARGLGGMMGYEFPQNFNFPYVATSVSEFWQRWHMTLTRWFKDYVYIPLGGSRVSSIKVLRNVFIVWMFTGIWHGAGYTFVFWGLWNFCWIYLEKEVQLLKKLPKVIGNMYMLLVIMIGWVFFMSPDIHSAFEVLKGMFFISDNPVYTPWLWGFLFQYAGYLLIAILYSYNLFGSLEQKMTEISPISVEIGYCMLFVITLLFVITSTSSPFLYFNF